MVGFLFDLVSVQCNHDERISLESLHLRDASAGKAADELAFICNYQLIVAFCFDQFLLFELVFSCFFVFLNRNKVVLCYFTI